MKKIIILTMISIASIAQANNIQHSGTVVLENVCGLENTIIESDDGRFIPASHSEGVFLYEGDLVIGDLFTTGYNEITKEDETGEQMFYNYESTLEDAEKIFCG